MPAPSDISTRPVPPARGGRPVGRAPRPPRLALRREERRGRLSDVLRRVVVSGTRRRSLATVASLAALPPLLLAVAASWGGAPPPRGPAIELASALGLVGLAVLVLQPLLPARLRALGGRLGPDVALSLHRRIGVIAVAIAVLHVVVLVVDDPDRLALLDPREAPARALAGTGSLLLLAALVVAGRGRGPLRLPAGARRGLHLTAGIGATALAVTHAIGVGHYVAPGPVLLGVGALVGLAVAALLHLRLVRPLRAARRPYRVERVVAERGGAYTVMLRADGHLGTPYRPGQFAWLRVGGSTLTGGERPFSFSSAADRPGAPAFTVRARGAVSGALRDLQPGDRVLLDGPHGTLHPSDRGLGLVLVAGGIGITPVVSMLRTLADRGDGRPMLLLYANRRWEDVPFREELDELAGRLDLRVVHVLGEPPSSWDGERGRLTADVIARHLPADAARHQCVVCGPPGMVAAAVDALTRLGIPRRRIDAEGFGTGALSWRSDPTTAAASLFAVVAVVAAVAFALVRS